MMTTDFPAAVTVVDADEYLPKEDEYDLGDVFDLADSTGPPPPQEFVIEDYIPAGCVTSLYAKGGSSKSFLALILAMHVVRGERIFDRDVLQGGVLYLDAELDRVTFERRAWMVAYGLGLEKQPRGLKYLTLSGSLTDPRCNAAVRRVIDKEKPRLVIIDSFTAAVRGKDTNSLDDVSARLRWLNEFGTVLMIDHTPKSADIGMNVTAIGSVAKQMFARSCLFIASNGDASILRHEKTNFGPLADPMRFALTFSPGFVFLEAPLPDDDPRLHGIDAALPAKERVRVLLFSGDYPDGATAAELASALEIGKSTVSNALTALKAEGTAHSDRGVWKPRPPRLALTSVPAP